MERTIRISIPQKLMSRQAADMAERMCDFESRVLLERENMVVDAKSLMGVVSAGLEDGQTITVMAEGPDEEEAVLTLCRLLGA